MGTARMYLELCTKMWPVSAANVPMSRQPVATTVKKVWHGQSAASQTRTLTDPLISLTCSVKLYLPQRPCRPGAEWDRCTPHPWSKSVLRRPALGVPSRAGTLRRLCALRQLARPRRTDWGAVARIRVGLDRRSEVQKWTLWTMWCAE